MEKPAKPGNAILQKPHIPLCSWNTAMGFSHTLLECTWRSQEPQCQKQNSTLLQQRGNKLFFISQRGGEFGLPCLWLTSPSNNTSSKMAFNAQKNHRQRKCEQELSLAYCHLGEQQPGCSLFHKEMRFCAHLYITYMHPPRWWKDCVQSADMSTCRFRTHMIEALIMASSQTYFKSTFLPSMCSYRVLNWK